MRNYEVNFYDYIDKKTGAHVVKATTTYAGKLISAYSKCDPQDIFDLELGKKVAHKRLAIKINHRRAVDKVAYAKRCKLTLEFLEADKRRIKKSMERAEIAALDRRVEIKQLETELAELLVATK